MSWGGRELGYPLPPQLVIMKFNAYIYPRYYTLGRQILFADCIIQ